MTPLLLTGIIEIAKSYISKHFKSSDDQEQAFVVLEKLKHQPQLLQLMINLAEAQSKSLFVAGWRPFIGWSSGILFGLGCIYDLLIYPLLSDFGIHAIQVDLGPLITILAALLGLSGLRTYDKIKGTTITYGKKLQNEE